MAEAIAVIGTAGSVANVIDVLSNTIATIRELRNEWKEADLTFLCLVSQLAALRAALTKIKEWADVDIPDLHHQLVMDLDTSMSCCRILISKIEGRISELHQTPDEKLDFSSKMKIVFGSKGMDDLQKSIERQTNALTLLLVACNCKTTSEQKVLLEKSSTRKVIRRIENDTESLIVHRDTASLLSRHTDRLSKISVVFPFDGELFISRVYDRVIRGSLKEALRRQQTDLAPNESLTPQATPTIEKIAGGVGTEVTTAKWNGAKVKPSRVRISRGITTVGRSQAIDHRLRKDGFRLRREAKVLLIGSGDSGKEDIVQHMKIINQRGYSVAELEMYRPTIYKNVIDCAKGLIRAMELFDIQPKQEGNKENCKYLLNYSVGPDPDERLNAKVGQAISSLWHDPCIPEIMEHWTEFYLMDLASYFFDEVGRIAASDYVPTEADVLRARTKTTGVSETRFSMGKLSINLVDSGVQRSERRKWIHCFENITSIIFVVNLAEYDQVLEESSQNMLMESLVLFDSVVNSRWFMRTSIILLLNNVSIFKQKLARSPLSNYFPDYSGGSDINRAAKYILWRFNHVNRAHLNLYPHLMDSTSTDTSISALVFAAVKETIVQNALNDSGILKKKDEKKGANENAGDQEGD